jgi:hypothetical protein
VITTPSHTGNKKRIHFRRKVTLAPLSEFVIALFCCVFH